MNYDSYVKYEVVDNFSYFRMKNTNLLHDYLKNKHKK